MKKIFGVWINCIFAAAMLVSCEQENENNILVCGTYTEMNDVYTGSFGIYSLAFDANTGQLSVMDSVQARNPSYIAVSDSRNYIYAVREISGNPGVYSIPCNKKTGEFREAEFAEGTSGDPCYVDFFNGRLLTADYSGGAVTVFDIKNDGRVDDSSYRCIYLSDDRNSNNKNNKSSHAHCVKPMANESALVVTDLGKDCVYFAKTSHTIRSGFVFTDTIQLKKGFGPRHVDFTKDGKFCYILGEKSGVIQGLSYDGETIGDAGFAVCDTLYAKGSADIHISPDGKFLYASNRLKGDGIRVFSIREDGKLKNLQYVFTGRHPRNFTFSPDGNYILVACRDDNKIEVYRRSKTTGIISPECVSELYLPKPVCLKFLK